MSKIPLRIAIVTSIHEDFDPRIWKHAVSLSRMGWEVHLISPWDIGKMDTQADIQCHCFKRVQSRWQRPWKIPLLLFRKLFPVIRNVDIIHFHDIDILPWMALISFFKPVVYDVHENYPEEMLDRYWIPNQIRQTLYHIVKHTQYILSRFIRNIVLVTEDQHKDFNHKAFNKILVYNYASNELIRSRIDDYLQRDGAVIFTGANYVSNGTLLILDIAERMRIKYPNLKFIMTDRFAGDFRISVEKKIRSKRLNDVIKIVPQVKSNDIMRLLNMATIGLCPNLKVMKQLIAIPTKIFEYMAAGIPVVASNFGAQQKIITESNAGFLADPEDPQSFVYAIEKLINHRQNAKALGENGLIAFEKKYNWEHQMANLENYYKQVLARSVHLIIFPIPEF